LQPVAVQQADGQSVDLLSVTNRNTVVNDNGFGSQWAETVRYEQYGFSVPRDRKDTQIKYPSNTPDPRREFIVTEREVITRDDLITRAIGAANFDGTVAVFVHGYNYSHQEALYRAAQMSADADMLTPPILFSWPSTASVTGYVADRNAALASRTELARLLRRLAAAPTVNRVVLFGHSMGGFLSMEAARQLQLQGRDDAIAKLQIILAAPDIDVDVFRAQLRDLGPLSNPITLLVSKTDKALRVSSVIGGERVRIGQLDVNDPLTRNAAAAENVRVIDISTVESSDGLGHDRYTSLFRFGGDLERIDTSMRHGGTNVGAVIFDAAGIVVSSPFRLAGQLARQ
jgi:esterase/lipase superfamily enzyme